MTQLLARSFSAFMFMLSVMGPVWAVPASSYALMDLEILEKERAYSEFFAHAFDIRPSERNDYWKKMMENMGEGFLRSMAQKPRLERSDYQVMETLTGQNVLRQNEFFVQQRQVVALKWFQQCLTDDTSATSPCWQDLLTFWEKDRQDIDLAPRLMTLVSPFLLLAKVTDPNDPKQRARAAISEMFILRPMLLDPIAGGQCKKADIRQVVWQAALDRWNDTMSPQNFTRDLLTVAHTECWNSITQWSRAFLLSGGSPTELDVTYQLLLRQGEMTPLERDLYLVSYLLGSPARGDIFNLAWNRVQELGLNPNEREKILVHLKRWRPLPGMIFADLDLNKRRTVTRHLRQHFPEFIDHYAHTCIDFFGGKKRFPEGNPAHACREMFDLATNEKDLLPVPMVEVFKQSLTF